MGRSDNHTGENHGPRERYIKREQEVKNKENTRGEPDYQSKTGNTKTIDYDIFHEPGSGTASLKICPLFLSAPAAHFLFIGGAAVKLKRKKRKEMKYRIPRVINLRYPLRAN